MQQAEWENLASLLSLALGVIAAVLLVAGAIPMRWLGRLEQWFSRVAERLPICFVLLPALSFTLNCLITLQNGIPLPEIHDEFSYLLAADTFAHGRVTNPTPPCWEHFETPQQLMRPTYMSKYPPAQGLALAVGQLAAGKPIVGAWISTAAAVAAIYWMLLGFVPRSWSLVGGLVAALHPQLLDWSQNYWGGSVAVLGGAVVLGAWGRLMLATTIGSSISLASGLIILANSRPFEGLLLVVPLLIALAIRRRNQWIRLLVPAGILLLLAAIAMGYYNFRITGHALRMPFAEYTAQYDVYPKLWLMPTRPIPVYRNAAMQFIHQDFEKGLYSRLRTLSGFASISAYRTHELVETCTKLTVLLVPLTIAMFTGKQGRIAWVWVTAGMFLLGLLAENFVLPHYEAPLLPAIFLLIIIGWQRLAGWSWNARALGRALAWATAIGFVAGAGMSAAQPVGRDDMRVQQQALMKLLPSLPSGRHLIFVTYNSLHSLHVEYVHNLSNLDQSRIIWARSFGPQADLPLARHFSDRRIWLLNVTGKLELNPYLDRSTQPAHVPPQPVRGE